MFSLGHRICPITAFCITCYLEVTIICRYIFLWIELKSRFARTKFCDLLRGIGTGSTISNAQYYQ